eukprot:1890679-Rhodomonas_salina.1
MDADSSSNRVLARCHSAAGLMSKVSAARDSGLARHRAAVRGKLRRAVRAWVARSELVCAELPPRRCFAMNH